LTEGLASSGERRAVRDELCERRCMGEKLLVGVWVGERKREGERVE
jgi:hypothetical protein